MGTGRFQKIAAGLSWLLLLLFALRSALCEYLHYDGAFNAQAAYNLYSSGSFAPDYLPLSFVQTKLPFQLLNGLFLYIFDKHPLSFHLASFVFLAALLFIVQRIAAKLETTLPFLGFACLLFYVPFGQFSINGLGEIPALTLVLAAVYLLIYGRMRHKMFLSGAALGTALAMKWMSFLYLPPFLFLLWCLRRRSSAKLLFTALAVFVCFTAAHYYQDGIEGLLSQWQGIKNHGLPLYPEALKQQVVTDFPPPHSFFREKWRAFTKQSTWWLLLFMIIGSVLSSFVIGRQRIGKAKAVFLFLSLFSLVHLVWYWTLCSRAWQRRTLAAEVCAVLAFSLLPLFSTRRYFAPIVLSVLLLFGATSLPAFYGRAARCVKEGVLDTCLSMESAYSALPAKHQIYASGYFHAPLWQLLTGARSRDALTQNVLFDCIETGCSAFYFSDPLSPAYNEFRFLRGLYSLREEYRNSAGYRIYRILDLRLDKKEYAAAIDFREAGKSNRISYLTLPPGARMANWPIENREQAFFVKTPAGTTAIELKYHGESGSEK